MSKPPTTSLTLLPLPTPSTQTHVALLPTPYVLLHNADSPSSYILKDESNLDSEGTLVPPIPTPYILSPPLLLQPHLNSLQIYNIQTLSLSSHTFPFYITSCTSTSLNLLLTSKSHLYIYSLSFQLLKRINLKWGGIISSILALPSNYISIIWDSNNGEGSSHSLINLEEQEGEHEGVEENESFALKLGKMHLQVIKGNWLITTLDGSSFTSSKNKISIWKSRKIVHVHNVKCEVIFDLKILEIEGMLVVAVLGEGGVEWLEVGEGGRARSRLEGGEKFEVVEEGKKGGVKVYWWKKGERSEGRVEDLGWCFSKKTNETNVDVDILNTSLF